MKSGRHFLSRKPTRCGPARYVTAQGFNLVTSGSNDDGCGFTTGKLTVTARYFDASNVEVDLPQAGGNAPSGLLNEGIVAQAQQGITGVWTAGATSPALPNTLDVQTGSRPAAGIAGSRFVYQRADGTFVNSTATTIGSIQFTDTVGLQAAANGTPDYNGVFADAGTATIVLTADKPMPTGVRFFHPNFSGPNTDCSDLSGTLGIPGVTVANSMSVFPSTQTVGNLTAVLVSHFNAGAFVTGGLIRRVCMQVPGNVAIPEISFTGYAFIQRNGAVARDTAGGVNCQVPLAKLRYNGGLIQVLNYVPASQAASGWEGFIRVINAGSLDATVSGYFTGEDGVATSPQVLMANLAARGNATLTSAAIEAALGAPPAPVSNPRLVITAPSNVLRVQNYIRQPGGFWTEMSGGQNDGTSASGSSR